MLKTPAKAVSKKTNKSFEDFAKLYPIPAKSTSVPNANCAAIKVSEVLSAVKVAKGMKNITIAPIPKTIAAI